MPGSGLFFRGEATAIAYLLFILWYVALVVAGSCALVLVRTMCIRRKKGKAVNEVKKDAGKQK